MTTDAVKSNALMTTESLADTSDVSGRSPESNSATHKAAQSVWLASNLHGQNVALIGPPPSGFASLLENRNVALDPIASTTLGAVPTSAPYDCAVLTRLSGDIEELAMQLQWVAGLVKPNGRLLISSAGVSPARIGLAMETKFRIKELSFSAGYVQCVAIPSDCGEFERDQLMALMRTTDEALSDRQRRLLDATKRWQRAAQAQRGSERALDALTKSSQQVDAQLKDLEKRAHELKIQNLDLLTAKTQLEHENRTLAKELRTQTNNLASVERTLAAVYRTDSYRLGNMLVQATQSWKHFAALPGAFWTLLQDGKKRRAAKAARGGAKPVVNSSAASTGRHSSPPENALQEYIQAFEAAGPAGVLKLLDPSGKRSARANAMSLLSTAKQFREQGPKTIEWPLAEFAVSLFKDDAILRGFFWAAVHANKPEIAYQTIRTIEQIYSTETDNKKLQTLEKLKQHRVYRLALLDLPLSEPATPITPQEGRIVYVLHNSLPFSSGGYATRSHGIASGLARAGNDVIVLTRPGFPLDANTKLSESDVPSDALIDGIRYERILEPKRATALLKTGGLPTDDYLRVAADALTDKLRELRPSVVVAASNYQTALPAMLAARRLGLPFVYEVRGFWEVTRVSRQPEFGETLAYAVERAMEGGLAARADQVFTLTEAMRDELVDRGVSREKIELLPNSCDPTRFHPGDRDLTLAQKYGIPSNVPVIGYIGTFVHYEGLEDLAGACAQLKSQGIEFRLLLVGNEDVSGNGVGPITQAIHDIATRAGFSDWLIMPGRIPHSDVERYYSLIDIAPFPRKPLPVCEMVSPMKPLEAMAMKKAVIVSSVRALSEMVRHEHNGLIFEKGNIEDFSRQMRVLIERPDLRKMFGENGRQWVEQERTWLKTGGKAHSVIETQLLNPKYPIKMVRASGQHLAELARYRALLANAYESGERNPVEPVSATKSIYLLHSSLPHLSGGYATRAHGILQGTIAAGFDIVPYTRPGFPVDIRAANRDKQFPTVDVIDGVAYHRIFEGANRSMVSEPEYMLSLIDEFEKAIRHERPAIVHGRSTYLTALPALIAARRAGLPFVYEVSGLWELVHASRDTTGANQALVNRIRDLETFTILNSDRIITLTEGMVDELTSRGADRHKITLVPNCVSPEIFLPTPRDNALAEKLGIPPGVPVVGYVGTFVDYEGLDDLLRAAKRVIAGGVDCRVLLVGDGRGQQNHKALARQLGDKVIMPGRVPHDEVANYYSLIDVLVYARKPWEVCETVSPMKPFEALAQEKAVIASSVRALAQIVLDGETGLIFEKGNVDDLAAKITQLFQSPELRSRLGKQGRDWVIKNRSWKKAGQEVVNVYRQILPLSS